MTQKQIIICIAIFSLIISAPAFAMMGMSTGNGQNITGQKHQPAMASTDHDRYMSHQTGGHLPRNGQGSMGHNADQPGHSTGNMDQATMDPDTMDHSTMNHQDNSRMQGEAEDFFRE